MEPLVDAQEAVSLCNSVLAIAGVKNPVSSAPEVRALGANASLFVAATEVLLGRRLEKVHRSPSNAIQRSANCAAVLSAVESALGDISLAHISPSAVVAGDLLHITSMMDLIVELARMPEVLRTPSSIAHAAAGVTINQHSNQSISKVASTHSNHRAMGKPTRSHKVQADPDSTVASSAGAAASLQEAPTGTGKLQRHPQPRPASPVHTLVPAAAAAVDPAPQAAVHQQQGLPTAAVGRNPAAAAAPRQPGSRSASPMLRSGTPAWPGDLADTSSALQGLANYKPKQLQHVMGLANSLLAQQHSGSDVGRSGTPVFGRAARTGPAAATTAAPAVVRGSASKHGAQAGDKVPSAALWLDSEESAAEQVLQQLLRANQNIQDSKASAAVPAAATNKARPISPLRHQQQKPYSDKAPEQARVGTPNGTVQEVGQQQLLLDDLEASQNLEEHMAADLTHMQSVAQQLAEIRAAEEQLELVEQQIQQHRQLLQQQEHAGNILALSNAATIPQGGKSCVITEITSSTDLDSHYMQGNNSGVEGCPYASAGPQQQRKGGSCYTTYDTPVLSSHDCNTSSAVMPASVHVPTTATGSNETVGGRLFAAANSPDLHLGLEVLRSAGLMDPAYDVDLDAEQDPAIETVATLILETDIDPDFGVDIDEHVAAKVANCIAGHVNDRDPDCGVDIDEQVAAEVANCIASHAILDHLQEVALQLASMQEQRQRQQLEERKESFRRRSQAEVHSNGQQTSDEMVTLAAWTAAEILPVLPTQQGEENSDNAVTQQHHQLEFVKLEAGVLAGQPTAADRDYKTHKTQQPSSRNKAGGKKPRKGSKQSSSHDTKQKQGSPALRRTSGSNHSVQRSPHTPHRLSSSSRGRASGDWAKRDTQSSRSRSASAVHHSSASTGSQTTPQQQAQAHRHGVASNETRRNLLQQLLDSSSSSGSSISMADPLAAPDSWSQAAAGYQITGAWTVTEMQARPQHSPPEKRQHPVDQQQGGKASAAAAKVVDARIQFEIAQQHMLQHQVLRQQAATVRRQQVKAMQQQELMSKQEAYDTKVAYIRKKQRRDQQRRDKLSKQSQAATEAAIEASEAAGLYDSHHIMSSHVKSPYRVAIRHSSPRRQSALQTQDAAASAAGSGGNDNDGRYLRH